MQKRMSVLWKNMRKMQEESNRRQGQNYGYNTKIYYLFYAYYLYIES